LLQVDSEGIRVPQISQNLSPCLTGLLQVGQVCLKSRCEGGLPMKRNLSFTY
jgi:hypothetical protein